MSGPNARKELNQFQPGAGGTLGLVPLGWCPRFPFAMQPIEIQRATDENAFCGKGDRRRAPPPRGGERAGGGPDQTIKPRMTQITRILEDSTTNGQDLPRMATNQEQAPDGCASNSPSL